MEDRQAKELFRGPMVSVATPFSADFELDLAALRDNIRFMVERGLRRGQGVLLVAAAGGEFPMLSMEERKEVTRVSVEAAQGEVPVATSIQSNGTRDVVERRAMRTRSAPPWDSSRRPTTTDHPTRISFAFSRPRQKRAICPS